MGAQELDFPVSSSRIKLSADGNFLVVTGIHPPQARGAARRVAAALQLATTSLTRAAPAPPLSQVKVYELSQLALKFERHLLSEARGGPTQSLCES